ncbi:MAG: resolvase [Nitrososphaeraceae archaeon]
MGNIRRSRGYSYEYLIVKRLNTRQWIAKRLGGSSVGLPDIVAVNNYKGILLAIEAKSGTGDALYVPSDQIQRCFSIIKMFRYYSNKHVILAFKFLRKKRIRRKNATIYESRKLVEYYKVVDILGGKKKIPQIKCNYIGETFVVSENLTKKIKFPEFKMPFQTNIRIINNNVEIDQKNDNTG